MPDTTTEHPEISQEAARQMLAALKRYDERISRDFPGGPDEARKYHREEACAGWEAIRAAIAAAEAR